MKNQLTNQSFVTFIVTIMRLASYLFCSFLRGKRYSCILNTGEMPFMNGGMKMDKEFRSIIVQACRKMLNEDLVKGTWGNVSFTDGERIYITPSGYPYDKMKEEDVIVIDYEGNVIEGSRVPSSEWKMHVAIYKARKDVKFILHTHPIYASIASVTMEEVPSLIEDSAMICGPEIRVAKYADPGSWELAENAAEALGNNSAVILKNHGLVNVGESFNEAFVSAKVTEKNIQVYIEALKLNREIFHIPESNMKKLREKYLKFYRQ